MERREYHPAALERARELRRTSTAWEDILWRRLRKCELRWRRQRPLDRFFLDLYCDRARLAVEVDGAKHDPEYDAWRDAEIAKYGVLTLRFTNVEVGAETDRCVEQILAAMHERRDEALPPERSTTAPMNRTS